MENLAKKYHKLTDEVINDQREDVANNMFDGVVELVDGAARRGQYDVIWVEPAEYECMNGLMYKAYLDVMTMLREEGFKLQGIDDGTVRVSW